MKKRISLKFRLHIFILGIITLISILTVLIAYIIVSTKLDNSYKQSTLDNAKNFSTMIDTDYISKLKTVLQSTEYQRIRNKAEETKNEALVREYLIDNGLWEQYKDTQYKIDNYINNISEIKYLYIISYEGVNASKDMYIIDDSNEPIYESGYFEDREIELQHFDIENITPTISNGPWGWLCSGYYPIYDDNNNCICLIGCDIDINQVMQNRRIFLTLFIIFSIILIIIVYIIAKYIINKLVINPLVSISNEIKNFNPAIENIIDLDISNDEIGDIHDEIRRMQINIIQYIDNLNQVENDMKIKDTQILSLKSKTYKDALTGINNVHAYNIKAASITGDYAIVMFDINNLKEINDTFGHATGNEYIQGCCKIICNAFKHSPVYRIGGDEFLAILQGVDYNNRQYIIDSLRIKLDEMYNNENIAMQNKYSMSIGFADHAPNETIEDTYKRADKLMYNNKQIFKQLYGSYR